MPWAKGQSGNPGGRRNSPSMDRAREAIGKVVDHTATELADWMIEIREKDGAKEAMKAFIGLAEYSLPKLARTEIAGSLGLHQLSDAELDAKFAQVVAELGLTHDPARLGTGSDPGKLGQT